MVAENHPRAKPELEIFHGPFPHLAGVRVKRV